LVPGTGDDPPGSLPAPGEQDLGGADAGDDRLKEEVPPQDQQLYRDPCDQEQAGQVPGGQPGPRARADQRG
jgi:hypothetical protein